MIDIKSQGFLLIHKPSGPTSHDVVNFVRRITGEKRVGHAGTLDPFASGLLIIGIGREATKHLGTFLKLDKRYLATLHLGAVSDTYDRTGKIIFMVEEGVSAESTCTGAPAWPPDLEIGGGGAEHRTSKPPERSEWYSTQTPTTEDIENILDQFSGPLLQIPPMYSAKKIGGKKLYQLARQGKEIERKPASITIFELNLVRYTWPTLELDIHCSSGTYIRSLAHDIGQALGVGAYLEELKRTAIGPWQLADAYSIEQLKSDTWTTKIIQSLDKIDQTK